MANYKILLIDYEPRSIERLVRPLESAGYTVEISTDGLSGIEAFDRLKPDLVVIEAMIPKKHGFEVCQEIKKKPGGKRTPVVITTAVYKGRKYRTQALHIYGCDEYIEKPISDEALLALVRRLLGDESEPAPVTLAQRKPVEVPKDPAGGKAAPAVSSSGSTHSSTSTARAQKIGAVSAIVGDLTEQEIMARLDALLPSDPFESDEESLGTVIRSLSQGESHDGEDKPGDVPTISLQADSSGASLLAADGIPQGSAFNLPDHLTDIPASFPDRPQPEAARADDTAQVVAFDSGRSRRARRSASRSESTSPSSGGGVVVAAAGSALRAPEPQRDADLPDVEETESKTPTQDLPRRIPMPLPTPEAPQRKLAQPVIWVGVLIGAALLAGAYVVFFRKSADPGEQIPPTTAFRSERVQSDAAGGSSESATVSPGEVSPQEPQPHQGSVGPQAEPPPPKTSAGVEATPAVQIRTTESGASPARSREKVATSPVPVAGVSQREGGHTAPSQVPATDRGPSVKENIREGSPASAPATSAPPRPREAAKESPASGADSLLLDQPPPPDLSAHEIPESVITPTLADEEELPPLVISRPLPSYTARARLLRQEGKVTLRVLIDETGHVVQSELVSGIPRSDLNDAALKAARQWVYKPARKGGVPVSVWKTEVVVFKL